MGNEQKKKGPPVKIPTAAEIKTYIMIIQGKIKLYRNKRLDAMKKKERNRKLFTPK